MSLSRKLARRITTRGPISVAEFMEAALSDPEFGYYITRNPIGARGDFITAPEISQIFGELIGLWVAALWLQINSPAQIRLVELGPGRGTLMADALRAMKSVPGLTRALAVHLVEMSPTLQESQAAILTNCGLDIHWHRHIEDVPCGPIIVIANEFFDALPIRQFIQTKAGWCERLVALNSNGRFEFTVSSSLTCSEETGISPQLITAPIGSLVEVCRPAEAIITTLSRRIEVGGGAALIIDYGTLKPCIGETLQAVSDHRFADVLQHPGQQDITAHVNFSNLAQTARQAGAEVSGPLTQARFLSAMGLETRLTRLTKASTPAKARDMKAAVARLIETDQMGTLFKVMAITAPNCAAPAPFS